MKNETMSRLVGGFLGAALIAIGMTALAPPIGAAQDPAQAPPPAGGRMGGGRGPMRGLDMGLGMGGPGRGRGGPGGPLGFGLNPRDLTDAQREQIQAIRERHAPDIQPLAERANKAHQALNLAVISGNGDLRGLSQEVGLAETELVYATAQVHTEVFGVLTPEQKQQIQDRQKEMETRRAQMGPRRPARGAGNAP